MCHNIILYVLTGSLSRFCTQEVVQRSDFSYIWPQTSVGINVSIGCPNNPEFSVTRECNSEGMWQPFDETVCGVVIQLLSGLNSSFTNVRNI